MRKINLKNEIFNYLELTRLNQMISIALISGKIPFDEISKSVHEKITKALQKRNESTIQEENNSSEEVIL